MRQLDDSAVSATIGLPIKSGTITHIQNAYIEAMGEIAKALIGYAYDPTKVYILNGCVNSGSGSNYNISAGSVFFNGKVYLVPAATFAISGSNVAVGVITLNYFTAPNADPVQFTDGITRTIHQIYTMVPQAGLSGSGAANYTNWVQLNLNIPQLNLEGSGVANVTGTYPNLTVNVPTPPSAFLTKGSTVLGDIPTGGTQISITFTAPIATSSYMVVGSFFSNSTTGGGHLLDSAVGWCWWGNTVDGFEAEFSETAPGVQNVTFYWYILPM